MSTIKRGASWWFWGTLHCVEVSCTSISRALLDSCLTIPSAACWWWLWNAALCGDIFDASIGWAEIDLCLERWASSQGALHRCCVSGASVSWTLLDVQLTVEGVASWWWLWNAASCGDILDASVGWAEINLSLK